MTRLSTVYRNPIIPEGYYYIKDMHLGTEDIPCYGKPKVFITVEP